MSPIWAEFLRRHLSFETSRISRILKLGDLGFSMFSFSSSSSSDSFGPNESEDFHELLSDLELPVPLDFSS